jgi:serine/threonine protein kinase
MNTSPFDEYTNDDEMDISTPINPIPVQRPVLSRYEVSGAVFEVLEQYELKLGIGQGAYGIVCSGVDKHTGEKCAVKKIVGIFDKDFEFQKRILREIKILKHFDHENIISLMDLIPPRSFDKFTDVYIVTDLMETDLRQIIKSDQHLTDQHIQYFLYQILRALKYIHSSNVLHRDLKPSNILLNADCELKICDFGLSRGIDFETDNPMMSTPYVATRWYRAPELLLMWETATKAIDIWSVGCIFAELLGRRVLFPGRNYLNQIELILSILGTPNDSDIKGCEKGIKYLKSLPKKERQNLQALFPKANPMAIDLLSKMLHFNPEKRITVEQALKHPYLQSLHDEEDEPTCNIFDFTFEQNVNQQNIKKMIYDEIMEWNLYQNRISGDAIVKQEIPTQLLKPKK